MCERDREREMESERRERERRRVGSENSASSSPWRVSGLEISFGVQVMRRSVRENEIGDGARPVLAPSL